jgi:PBP1b-binding outer membrane lipoprotein LpoB
MSIKLLIVALLASLVWSSCSSATQETARQEAEKKAGKTLVEESK